MPYAIYVSPFQDSLSIVSVNGQWSIVNSHSQCHSQWSIVNSQWSKKTLAISH